MIHLEVDTNDEIVRIGQRLEKLAFEAPDVLRLSINAAARKVRKQLTEDVAEVYTIDDAILRDRSKGAPRLQTAKPGTIEAVIRSRGPVNDLMDFLVQPSSAGARAKVLRSGGMKPLERGGAPAFITQFSSGHRAIVQRQIGQTYSMDGARRRIERYGYPHKGQWPDLTRIKKLLGPAVPSMMANEQVQESARVLLYRTLDAEIDKRIAKALKANGGAK